MGFGVFFLLLLKIKRPGRLLRQIRCIERSSRGIHKFYESKKYVLDYSV